MPRSTSNLCTGCSGLRRGLAPVAVGADCLQVVHAVGAFTGPIVPMVDLDRGVGAATPAQLTLELITLENERAVPSKFSTDLCAAGSPCHYWDYPRSGNGFQIIGSQASV